MRARWNLLGSVLVAGCSFSPAPGQPPDPTDAPSAGDASGPGRADAAIGTLVDAPGNIRPVDAPTSVSVDAAPVGPMCPAGYGALAGAPATSRYRMFSWDNSSSRDESLTWTQARDRCANEGTHLAYFQDAAEAKAVEDALMVNPSSPFIWVGVSDMVQEGTWVAVSGGATGLYWLNWGPNEPNGGSTGDCMLQYEQEHFDWVCGPSYPFACECE